MNKLTIIGNLTRDPESRTTSSGITNCSFTVAVNRRRSSNANGNQPEADFFRVTAWRQLGELCQRYLAKGRKVAVTGSVSVNTYTGNDGVMRASLEVSADEVEFLSSRSEDAGYTPAPAASAPAASPVMEKGFEEVDEEDLPF